MSAVGAVVGGLLRGPVPSGWRRDAGAGGITARSTDLEGLGIRRGESARGLWPKPRVVQYIVPPISLDSSLAIHPGSKREEAADVSEYGSTERGGVYSVGS